MLRKLFNRLRGGQDQTEYRPNDLEKARLRKDAETPEAGRKDLLDQLRKVAQEVQGLIQFQGEDIEGKGTVADWLQKDIFPLYNGMDAQRDIARVFETGGVVSRMEMRIHEVKRAINDRISAQRGDRPSYAGSASMEHRSVEEKQLIVLDRAMNELAELRMQYELMPDMGVEQAPATAAVQEERRAA